MYRRTVYYCLIECLASRARVPLARMAENWRGRGVPCYGVRGSAALYGATDITARAHAACYLTARDIIGRSREPRAGLSIAL